MNDEAARDLLDKTRPFYHKGVGDRISKSSDDELVRYCQSDETDEFYKI